MTNNFLTPTIAAAVEAARRQPSALISAPRVFDNMLSSQPLAFNLFAELQDDLELAAVVGRALWPGLVHRVEAIRFEWSPGRDDPRFLRNRSAFDVAWLCRDSQGYPTCVGIEVKYHEDMTQDPGSPDNPRYTQVAVESGVFKNPDEPELRALPLRQIWFDHLLALSMIGDETDLVARSRFVLLAPAINSAAMAVDSAYRGHLRDALTYERRTLEEVTAVMAGVVEADWLGNFNRRYLTPTATGLA